MAIPSSTASLMLRAAIRVCAGLCLLTSLEGVAFATPIALNVNPHLVGEPQTSAPFLFAFPLADQLDGITLSGQTLVLDFFFADDIVAHVRGGPEGGFGVAASLMLQTDAGTFPGFAGESTTGFFLGADRRALHAPLGPERVGSGAGPNGTLSVGLVPGIRNFNMSGVRFLIALPNTGHRVTGASFSLFSDGFDDGTTIRFARRQSVPEGAISPWLLALTAMMLFAAHAYAPRVQMRRPVHAAMLQVPGGCTNVRNQRDATTP